MALPPWLAENLNDDAWYAMATRVTHIANGIPALIGKPQYADICSALPSESVVILLFHIATEGLWVRKAVAKLVAC